jgi:hypothetical protein
MTLRLYILNFAGLCFVIWAAWLGYVQFVFSHDISHLSYLISAIFLASIAGIFCGKTSHLAEVKEQLTGLGFIGTLVGFILAMKGLADSGSLGSPDGLANAGTSLLSGLGVAFCSSLVGAVCAAWISVNAWLLSK